MDMVELEALIGVVLIIGAQKQSKVSTKVIWSELIGQDFVRATFARNRFFELLSNLRFNKKETRRIRMSRSKFAAFEEIFDRQMANLQRYYVPGPYLTVDE